MVARSELHAVLHDGPLRPRDRRIDAVVTRIRHKLAPSPYRYVHSHRGVGYRFDAAPGALTTSSPVVHHRSPHTTNERY